MFKKHFMHQKMMTKVLIALVPVYLMSIYLFGWRVLLLLAATLIAGAVAELAIMRLVQQDKVKLTEACFVSAALFTLTLPPATPVWVAVIGILFGIGFGKAVFGGFGQNIFNPALVGRCFIYITFPAHMTRGWVEPFVGGASGFAASGIAAPGSLAASSAAFSFPAGFAQYSADVLSEATPIVQSNAGPLPSLPNLLLGFSSGSLGEASAVLILLCGIYLVVTKTASWKIMVSTLGSAAILATILWAAGVTTVPPQYQILSGGLVFAAVFMATDPVSAPRDETSKWIFGALIGAITIIIRRFGVFVEGAMFAILIANALAPLLDRNVRELKVKMQQRRKGEGAPAALAKAAVTTTSQPEVGKEGES